MAVLRLTLTNTWQQIANDVDYLMINASKDADLFIGDVAPAASAPGLNLKWNLPLEIALVNYGGGAWVRGTGTVTYALSV